MAIQSPIDVLDPSELYMIAPKWWDWFLMYLLFYFIIKRALTIGTAFAKEKTGVLQNLLTGKEASKEVKGLSVVLALILSTSLVVIRGITLEYLFASGMTPGFLSLMAGLLVYAVLGGFIQNKLMRALLALFVISGLFSTFSYGGKIGGAIFWPIIIIALIAALASGKRPAGVEATERTVSNVERGAGDVERELVSTVHDIDDVVHDAGTAREQASSSVSQGDQVAASLERVEDDANIALTTQRQVINGLAEAMPMVAEGKSADEVKQKLKEEGHSDAVVEEVIKKLPKPVGEATEPLPADLEETPVSVPTVIDLIKSMDTTLKELPAYEATVDRTQEMFNQISKKIRGIPSRLINVIARYNDLESNIEKIETDVKNWVTKLKADPIFESKAEALNVEVGKVKGEVEAEKKGLTNLEQSLGSFMIQEDATLKKIASAIKVNIYEIKKKRKALQPLLKKIRKAKATYKDIQALEAQIKDMREYTNKVKNDFATIGGSPETVEALGSANVNIKMHIRKWNAFRKELTGVTKRVTALGSEVAKERKAEKRREEEAIAKKQAIAVVLKNASTSAANVITLWSGAELVRGSATKPENLKAWIETRPRVQLPYEVLKAQTKVCLEKLKQAENKCAEITDEAEKTAIQTILTGMLESTGNIAESLNTLTGQYWPKEKALIERIVINLSNATYFGDLNTGMTKLNEKIELLMIGR